MSLTPASARSGHDPGTDRGGYCSPQSATPCVTPSALDAPQLSVSISDEVEAEVAPKASEVSDMSLRTPRQSRPASTVSTFSNSTPWEMGMSDDSILKPGQKNREVVKKLVGSSVGQTISVFAISMTLVLTCMEVDLRAKDEALPTSIQAMMACCFMVYIVEFIGIAYVERKQTFTKFLNCLDLFVILVGLVDYSLDLVGRHIAGPMEILRFIRFLRLVHLVQSGWVKKNMRELRKLVMMISSSFKTLFWSFLFCFVVMTFWSTLAVELLHRRMLDLVAEDPALWANCARCRRAFASVMDANLTFFQTIVAGDSWGEIAIPLIEAHPWSAVIFVGALMTLVYGVLGLIVAVVVDMFADLRAKDVANIAHELDQHERDLKQELHTLFLRIDKDRNGQVSLRDVLKAAKRVPSFKDYLRILRVDLKALERLFRILDVDGNGQIDHDEFVEVMYTLMTFGTGGTANRNSLPGHMPSGTGLSAMSIQSSTPSLPRGGSAFDPEVNTHNTYVEQQLGSMQEKIISLEKSVQSNSSRLWEAVTSQVQVLEGLSSIPFQRSVRDSYTSASEVLHEAMSSPFIRCPSEGGPYSKGPMVVHYGSAPAQSTPACSSKRPSLTQVVGYGSAPAQSPPQCSTKRPSLTQVVGYGSAPAQSPPPCITRRPSLTQVVGYGSPLAQSPPLCITRRPSVTQGDGSDHPDHEAAAPRAPPASLRLLVPPSRQLPPLMQPRLPQEPRLWASLSSSDSSPKSDPQSQEPRVQWQPIHLPQRPAGGVNGKAIGATKPADTDGQGVLFSALGLRSL